MNELVIKSASIEDLDILMEWRLEVLKDVFSIPPHMDMSALERTNREYYQHAFSHHEHIACLGWLDDEIVGCGGVCLYREMPSPDNASGKCAYLMNIYVRPKFRHLGIGRNIVHWLVKQVQKLGITKIYLETSASGQNMYRAIGFIDMQDMMILNNKANRYE